MTDAPLMTGEAFEGEDESFASLRDAGAVPEWDSRCGPAPRYDDVYFEGVAMLDRLAYEDDHHGFDPPPYPHRRGWRFRVTLTRDRVALWLERAARWVRG